MQLNSSRNRPPNSGRNNLSASGAQAISQPEENKFVITKAARKRLNDPIQVFRPFSPEGRVYDAHILRPPVLPKSQHSIYPPDDTPRPPNRKLSCPEDWPKKLNAPNFFETADFKTVLDDGAKEKFCRDFVERNQDRLWKFDLNYLHLTPRTVCDQMVVDSNFIGMMRKYYLKEQTLNLGASDKFARSIVDRYSILLI